MGVLCPYLLLKRKPYIPDHARVNHGGTKMNRIETDSKVDLLFQLRWKSDHVNHTDCFQANQANLWRDLFPADLSERLLGRQGGDDIAMAFAGGQAVPLHPRLHRVPVLPDGVCRRPGPGGLGAGPG